MEIKVVKTSPVSALVKDTYSIVVSGLDSADAEEIHSVITTMFFGWGGGSWGGSSSKHEVELKSPTPIIPKAIDDTDMQSTTWRKGWTQEIDGVPTESMKAHLKSWWRDGNKILAIKRTREVTGWGLRESKKYVENLV